jgi:hypothetical protein
MSISVLPLSSFDALLIGQEYCPICSRLSNFFDRDWDIAPPSAQTDALYQFMQCVQKLDGRCVRRRLTTGTWLVVASQGQKKTTQDLTG